MIRFTKYEKFGAYHWEQYRTLKKYKDHADRVQQWIKEKSILDVGAGDGLITSMLGEGAVGIEYEESGVKLAVEKGINVIQGDAYSLPFEDNTFEAVTMIDVLEHFDDPQKALREARRVAPILYVNTPPKKDDGTLTDKFHIQEWSPVGLMNVVEKEGYVLDGAITVYPKEKMMYAKFIRI